MLQQILNNVSFIPPIEIQEKYINAPERFFKEINEKINNFQDKWLEGVQARQTESTQMEEAITIFSTFKEKLVDIPNLTDLNGKEQFSEVISETSKNLQNVLEKQSTQLFDADPQHSVFSQIKLFVVDMLTLIWDVLGISNLYKNFKSEELNHLHDQISNQLQNISKEVKTTFKKEYESARTKMVEAQQKMVEAQQKIAEAELKFNSVNEPLLELNASIEDIKNVRKQAESTRQESTRQLQLMKDTAETKLHQALKAVNEGITSYKNSNILYKAMVSQDHCIKPKREAFLNAQKEYENSMQKSSSLKESIGTKFIKAQNNYMNMLDEFQPKQSILAKTFDKVKSEFERAQNNLERAQNNLERAQNNLEKLAQVQNNFSEKQNNFSKIMSELSGKTPAEPEKIRHFSLV